MEDCLRCRKVLELAGLHKVIEMSYILSLTLKRDEILKASETGGKPKVMMRHMWEFSLACIVHSVAIAIFLSLDATDYTTFSSKAGWLIGYESWDQYVSDYEYDDGRQGCLLNHQLRQLLILKNSSFGFKNLDINEFETSFPDAFTEPDISFEDAQDYCNGRLVANGHIAAFAAALIMIMQLSSRIKSLCAKRSLRYMLAVANDMQEKHIFFLFEDVLTFVSYPLIL